MNHSSRLFLLIGISLLSFSCFADDKFNTKPEKYQQTLNKEKNKVKNKESSKTKPRNKIDYIPPYLGAPSTDRLNGMGARDPGKQMDLLFSVLTPSHTGLTSQSQPSLYWFTSRPISNPFQFIEFVLNSEESIAPILRKRLPQAEETGIHQLNMEDYNIILKPEIEYSWSIALIKDLKSRSMDLVSSAKIKYVKPDRKTLKRIQTSTDVERAFIYAQTGYWYEAIATAIDQQKEYPYNLINLINEVELQEIAEYLAKEM